jgi:chemotaxis protein CheD
MSGARHMVRMAEQVVSREPTDMLVSLGLGSCIGLALVDEHANVAGLVHIVLPVAPPGVSAALAPKFADTAVPKLLEDVMAAGARSGHLRAVLCGGAHMFGNAGSNPMMQIGSRNADATMVMLQKLRIRVRAYDTGGNQGRSIEVRVATGEVYVRGVGQPPRPL